MKQICFNHFLQIRSCYYQHIGLEILTSLPNTFILVVESQVHNHVIYSIFAFQHYQFESVYEEIRLLQITS